jgi:hypothetical protein
MTKTIIKSICYSLLISSAMCLNSCKKSSTTNNTITEIVIPGTVGTYKFNNNADDSSGNHNNGTVVGATITSGHTGTVNSAYHFTGPGSYIDLPSFSSMVTGEEFSISLWSKADAQNANTVFALNPDNTSDRLLAHVNYMTGTNITKIIFDLGDALGSGRHELLNQPFTTAWEHYVFVASQSGNSVKVYRNNVLIINESGYVAVNKNKILRIGYLFFGSIDDVRIINRAVTAAEVTTLYGL